MIRKASLSFLYSAGLVLVLTAGAKLFSTMADSKILAGVEPILRLKYQYMVIIAALAELGVAIYLLLGRSIKRRAFAILWLASNFLVYRGAAKFLEVELCPCLGTLAPNLPLTIGQVNHLLTAIVFYLMAGSVWIVFMGGEGNEQSVGAISDAAVPKAGAA